MLKIVDLYKENKNEVLKNISLSLLSGKSISIECSDDTSNLLIDLILGREVPAKGEIYIDQIKNVDYVKRNPGNIGIIFKEDALYEDMKVHDYLKFFSKLHASELDLKELMLNLAIYDIAGKVIKQLDFSQKRRISFAREILKQPKLLIIQEPILNVNKDTAKIITVYIESLCMKGTSVFMTSVYFKNALLVGDQAYCIDQDGIIEINPSEEADTDKEAYTETNKIYKIEKIPAKGEDKILLFDPIEIDYVESIDGISYLYIRGDKFPCSISLADLEDRLIHFGFFRCHRSYLINLQRVREVITWSRSSYSLSLGDKTKSTIPLSKGRLEELKSILKL
jgi:ABC-2 type transport system ATP-binding protein